MEPGKNKGKFIQPEEMEKRNIFEVPDGYFEDLPMIIQSRVAGKKAWWQTPVLMGALKYAVPALVILVIAFFAIRQPESADLKRPEALIAEVSTEDLIDFLEDSDITTEEILSNLNLREIEFDLKPEGGGILELDSDDLEEFYEEYELLNEYI